MCFSNLQHSLYYPEEKGKKTFDRKEVSTELCGFASLRANTYYETVFPPPPNYCLNYYYLLRIYMYMYM